MAMNGNKDLLPYRFPAIILIIIITTAAAKGWHICLLNLPIERPCYLATLEYRIPHFIIETLEEVAV